MIRGFILWMAASYARKHAKRREFDGYTSDAIDYMAVSARLLQIKED